MDTSPQAPPRAGSLPLVGGMLALDFCNTSSGRGTDRRLEHLHGAADLLAWGRHAAILDESADAHLRHLCQEEAEFDARLFGRALRLRDAIFHIGAAVARNLPPDQADVDAAAGCYAACIAKARLHGRGHGFGWSWDHRAAPEEALLGPIAASALQLLTAADGARLKQCGGRDCGWLFLDMTKSNNRRWCEMEVCGNRAKQRRRRERQRTDR